MAEDYLSKPLFLGPNSGITGASTTPEESTTGRGLTGGLGLNTHLSPYLNYDARLLQQAKPEFIFPEGATKQRGRFELAFSQIGTSVMLGAGIGGLAGFYNGMIISKSLNHTGKLWRTQMLNHVMKQGSGTANTLGTLAVMYSAFGVLLQNLRGEDDQANTLIAGLATGYLYKSTAGLKKSAIGGAVGLGVTALYCLLNTAWNNSKDNYNIKFF